MTNATDPAFSQNRAEASPQKQRRTFKIGGRNKFLTQERDEQPTVSTSPNESMDMDGSPAKEPAATTLKETVSEVSPSMPEVEHEETPEEKAERRRLELKRKNEELVKKVAHKKKRRF